MVLLDRKGLDNMEKINTATLFAGTLFISSLWLTELENRPDSISYGSQHQHAQPTFNTLNSTEVKGNTIKNEKLLDRSNKRDQAQSGPIKPSQPQGLAEQYAQYQRNKP